MTSAKKKINSLHGRELSVVTPAGECGRERQRGFVKQISEGN